jgi:multiple sugar transport system permease protein
VAAIAHPRPKRAWRNALEGRRLLGVVLIAPAVLFIVALVGVPLGLSIYLSFTDATTGELSGTFVGLDNFTSAWDDPNFVQALKNTVIFTVVSQIVVVVCAGLIAHALVRPFRGKWLLRFLIILPWAAPIPLTAVAWLWIFDSLFSVINWTVIRADFLPGATYSYHPYELWNLLMPWEIVPFNQPQWRGHEDLARAAITIVHTWRVIPFAVVIFLAGLASIPAEVDDAAKIDGATGLKKFWYVTLPLQLPIAIVAVLFGIVFTATDMAVVYIVTQGGPFNSSHMLTSLAYLQGVNAGSLAEGAAISLYLLPVLLVVAVGMLYFARKVEVT